MQNIIQGVIAPSVTAFRDDESVDEEATARHIDWLIDNGVDAVTPCGSSGEFVALHDDEAKRLIQRAVEVAAKRVPVFAATGRYATRDTIALSQFAEDAGASAVMVCLPYYLLPDKRSIKEHFRSVKRELGIPIILYNNPWTCGVELDAREIAELCADGTIAAVKASHGDPYRVNELRHLCGDNLVALYGHDYAPLEALLAGADGWLTGIINVFPRLAKELWVAAHVEKNIDAATRVWRQMMPYVYFSMQEKNDGSPHLVSIYKEALRLQGRDVGKPRRPLRPLTPEERTKLERALKAAVQ
jgi:4-hydroxy-tetrahydrodipicolinate synthase